MFHCSIGCPIECSIRCASECSIVLSDVLSNVLSDVLQHESCKRGQKMVFLPCLERGARRLYFIRMFHRMFDWPSCRMFCFMHSRMFHHAPCLTRGTCGPRICHTPRPPPTAWLAHRYDVSYGLYSYGTGIAFASMRALPTVCSTDPTRLSI